MPSVLVSIVTYNSAAHVTRCLQSLLGQKYTDFQVVVADNASQDETIKAVRKFDVALLVNPSNLGFCTAHNRVIQQFQSDYVLVLNPDVQLAPDFLRELVSAVKRDANIGTVCGKLLRLQRGNHANVIDSAGMVLRRNQRHLDRGAGKIDTGQYDTAGFVFGASGAAALYCREFVEDVRCGGDFFDSNFFAFREDADLSWRAQWLGWKCLYWPAAVAWHERRVTPERRRHLPPEINYHSVKNRFLMRIKNLDGRNYLRHFLPITVRDFGIFAYVLSREQSSLPAFSFVLKHYGEYYQLRKELKRRRRVDSRIAGRWFEKEIEPL
ncbi:MAG TPA: glycosyltransferase family 2 protein [Acidobacteriota bacterium]|jgi:GT2 family glycosyltransferase|nr:glycosyltransferase family 2 protein [Acidobacteriota bacterium]